MLEVLSGEEGEAAMSKSVSFERPLADGDRLEVTIKSEDKTTFQPPSGWTLTADDLIETRHSGERMYISTMRRKNRISDLGLAIILMVLILIVAIAIIALLLGPMRVGG